MGDGGALAVVTGIPVLDDGTMEGPATELTTVVAVAAGALLTPLTPPLTVNEETGPLDE